MIVPHYVYDSKQEYLEALRQFLGGAEGSSATVYDDGVGVPTIGHGYALLVRNNIGQLARRSWESDFGAAGINFTVAEQEVLNDLLDDILASPSQISQLLQNYNDNDNAFNLLGNQQINLYETSINTYIVQANNWINGVQAGASAVFANSKEMIAFVSLAFNGVLATSTGLRDAVISGNRAEAWYEIRYNTNSGTSRSLGIANRRVAESDMFGLCDSGSLTEDKAKEIFRMYTRHKGHAGNNVLVGGKYTILGEESQFATSYLGSNSFASQSAQAKNFLVDKFGEGVVIDGEILVGAGLDSYEYIDNGNYDDILTGTSKSDLIFGERGDDILIGNGGGDYMEGGEGFDTYYTN
ncbi:MAG: hypothetical protein M0Q25_08165, partial [Sulfurospirillaceae bacterium]|nr:hypothetical protein [Sulfurospirillaceae bacterium]